MAFWSGERLQQEISAQQLIAPYTSANLDCASYRLSVGEQVFATTDKLAKAKPSDPIIQVLGKPPNHTLRIPPGQFAFLLTEEVVNVPANALALISMRAGYKLKGLINVSGFHVDPGWSGKLLFSVYNAGPAELVVERGEPMFLIVYADLDQTSAAVYRGKSQNQNSIKASLLEGMGGQVFSPIMLQRKVDELTTRVDNAERSVSLWRTIAVAFGTVAGLFFGGVAVFATFAPATLGLILGAIVQGGGYDLRLKVPETVSATPSEPLGAPKSAVPRATSSVPASGPIRGAATSSAK